MEEQDTRLQLNRASKLLNNDIDKTEVLSVVSPQSLRVRSDLKLLFQETIFEANG